MNVTQEHRRLSLPTGNETLHLQEIARYRKISQLLSRFFEAWGYRPVETPILDYYEVYRRLLDGTDIRQIYRAVDRQGEILALRSDTTMFLAKQLGLYLSPEELPVRVYYDEQIVRAEEQHDISSNESQQTGIELVGINGHHGDVEVLLLAREALKALGVDSAVIHVGSHSVIDSMLSPLDERDQELCREAIRRRSFSDSVLEHLSPSDRDTLRFIGSIDQFDRFFDKRHREFGSETKKALSELRTTLRGVADACDDLATDEIRVDFSELGSHGYYTGIAFAAYCEGGNSPIVRGGRYDHLLGSFGFDVPSVGFSMFPRKLPPDTMAADHADGKTKDTRDVATRRSHGRSSVEQQREITRGRTQG